VLSTAHVLVSPLALPYILAVAAVAAVAALLKQQCCRSSAFAAAL